LWYAAALLSNCTGAMYWMVLAGLLMLGSASHAFGRN
jgi:hypothetical protein